MNKDPFSRIDLSPAWNDLRKFYQHYGIDAFKKVPYLITSTENLARLYLTTLHHWVDINTTNFIELGAGHGQFGYRFAKSLPHSNYHLIDCSKPLQEFWLNHPKWIEIGLRKNKTHIFNFSPPFYQPQDLVNNSQQPTVWIANYFFDSAPFRGFHKSGQEWKEIYIKKDHQDKITRELDYTLKPILDLNTNTFLRQWLDKTKDHTTSLPTLLLNFIDWCAQQPLPMIIIGSDFISSNNEELTPKTLFSENGCLSTTLNLALIEHYIKTQHPGANYFETNCTDSLKTFLITFNSPKPSNWKMPSFSTADINNLLHPLEQPTISSIDLINSFELTHHDPWLLPNLLKHIQSPNFTPPQNLFTHIEKIAKNVYPMPDNNSWLICAHILSFLNQGEMSLKWVKRHTVFYGESSVSLREQGYALCSNANLAAGLPKLHEALKKNPQCKTTLKLIKLFNQ